MRDDWLLAEKSQYMPVAINRHIASLQRPPNYCHLESIIEDSDRYFPIYTSDQTDHSYPKYNPELKKVSYEKFVPISQMPAFNDQPLACLTFTGALDDSQVFLHTQASNTVQVSAMFALKTYIEKATTTSFSDDLNGRKLDFHGGMSSVLASRAAKGSFFKFVERLAYHLTLEGHISGPFCLANCPVIAWNFSKISLFLFWPQFLQLGIPI